MCSDPRPLVETDPQLQAFLEKIAQEQPLWRVMKKELAYYPGEEGEWVIKSRISNRTAYIKGNRSLGMLMKQGFFLLRESQMQWRALPKEEAQSFIDRGTYRLKANTMIPNLIS